MMATSVEIIVVLEFTSISRRAARAAVLFNKTAYPTIEGAAKVATPANRPIAGPAGLC